MFILHSVVVFGGCFCNAFVRGSEWWAVHLLVCFVWLLCSFEGVHCIVAHCCAIARMFCVVAMQFLMCR